MNHDFKNQTKEIGNKFELEKIKFCHIEKMAANKTAAEKQQNDHTLSMAKLRLEEKNLEMKKEAINHSSVKSQTVIPGQFIKKKAFFQCLLQVLMNGGTSEKHLTKETIQFLKTIHQSQITSVRRQQSDENRSSEFAIEFIFVESSFK